MVIVGLLGAALAWASIGKVDIIATAQGRIIPARKSKTIQPFETSVVKAIEVADGEHVVTGQVLVRLDPTENQAERDKARQQLIEAQLDRARLRALVAGHPATFDPPPGASPSLVDTARRQMVAQATEQAAKLTDLDHQIAAKEAELRADQAEIARIDATMPMLEEHAQIRGTALKSGAGNLIDYVDATRQIADQRHERIAQQEKVAETAQSVIALRQQRSGTKETSRKGLLADLEKAEPDAALHQQEEIKAAQPSRS